MTGEKISVPRKKKIPPVLFPGGKNGMKAWHSHCSEFTELLGKEYLPLPLCSRFRRGFHWGPLSSVREDTIINLIWVETSETITAALKE